MVEITLVILMLIGGILLIAYTSSVAVKHTAILASGLGISPLIIGITFVSIGTDISEIFNSIIACSMGHGDINVGDSVGSSLIQITLVFGLLPIICGSFKVDKKTFTIIGACEILALIVVFTVVAKGYFMRLDALFMMGCFVLYTIIIYNVIKDKVIDHVSSMNLKEKFINKKYHISIAAIAFFGVAISSFIIIQSIITLSLALNIHEYIISFFILGLGTSLPELAVDINALKKKQYEIAIGDIVGSCIVDSTISIAIGLFLFPQAVSAELAIPTILYAICASIIVITVVSVRGKVDKKAGILFISIYFGSFLLLFILL